MLPDRVSNPGPLAYESGALPIALRGPARNKLNYRIGPKRSDSVIKLVSVLFGKCTNLVITKC